MAILDGTQILKTRENMGKSAKIKDKKVLVVAQDLKFARVLAGNNKTARDRALRSLKKWFAHRQDTLPLTEDDFLRIWKGLFYSMWMSDKPLIQEECAENISKLVHLPAIEGSMLFYKAGMRTLINEWFGIDQLRLDKFLMLVRRLLRQTLLALKEHNWKKQQVAQFCEVNSATILSSTQEPPIGLLLHFIEIYLEEIAKVSEGKLHPDLVTDFIRPFIKKLVNLTDNRQIEHMRKFIFTYLIRQSDLGMEYNEKYMAWKSAGFPGSIHSMQKVSKDSDDDDVKMSDDESSSEETTGETALDPRAGRVNVEIPQLKFSAKSIALALMDVKFEKGSTKRARKFISLLVSQFTKLANGDYPLGARAKIRNTKVEADMNIRKAVNRLVKFDKINMHDQHKRTPEIDDEEEDALPKSLKRLKLNPDDEKLQKFIEQSEAGLEPVKKLRKRKAAVTNEEMETNYDVGTPLRKKPKSFQSNINTRLNSILTKPGIDVSNVEFIVQPNLGVWVVYDDSKAAPVPDSVCNLQGNAELGSFLEQKLSSDFKLNPVPVTKAKSPKVKKISPKKQTAPESKSTEVPSPSKCIGGKVNTGGFKKTTPKKQSPCKTGQTGDVSITENGTELFPKSEWDEPLKDGEYEITIPAKSHVKKLKASAIKQHRNLENSIYTNLNINRRYSLDPKLFKTSTPVAAGSKKIKINTKLNKSQEVHEYHAQILSSPAIPYDASRKPSKPLLKTPVKTTPINPFYKQLK